MALSYVTNLFQPRLAGPELLEDTITPWLGPLAPWTRKVTAYNDERARNWFLVCFVLSMLLHISLFLIPISQRMGEVPAASEARSPLTVSLTRPKHSAPPVEKVEPVQPPQTTVLATKHRPTNSKPTFTVRPQQQPQPIQPPQPPQPPQPTTPREEPDMMARINARRAERQAAEDDAAQQNAAAAAASRGPSVEDRIREHIRQAQSTTDGTGGVFMVKSIGVREGTFVFNGWNPVLDRFHREITVDAGEGGNVRLAIVRGMIQEIIRKFKTGDFVFESHRLGKDVILSAKPADNERLENFLMQEFFSEDVPKSERR